MCPPPIHRIRSRAWCALPLRVCGGEAHIAPLSALISQHLNGRPIARPGRPVQKVREIRGPPVHCIHPANAEIACGMLKRNWVACQRSIRTARHATASSATRVRVRGSRDRGLCLSLSVPAVNHTPASAVALGCPTRLREACRPAARATLDVLGDLGGISSISIMRPPRMIQGKLCGMPSR